MIKTFEQAKKVQQRRVKIGLRGYAKAVRRFMVRDADIPAKAHSGLPVNW